MNSLAGKRALSLVCKTDIAHAGHDESINMVFKDLRRDPPKRVLPSHGWRSFTIGPLHPDFADMYGALIARIREAEKKNRKTIVCIVTSGSCPQTSFNLKSYSSRIRPACC
ncbi:MAG: hypothetical protein AAFX93_18905 [Verrucomicrobiota bacterium]